MSINFFKLIGGIMVAGTAVTGVIYKRMKNNTDDYQGRKQNSASGEFSNNKPKEESPKLLRQIKQVFRDGIRALEQYETRSGKPRAASSQQNTASTSRESIEQKNHKAKITKEFLAIRGQNTEELRASGLPTVDELYELYTKSKSAEARYDASVKAKSILFGRGNICDCLNRVRSYKDNIPDSVTVVRPDETKMVLHNLVWDTDLSLVFSFINNLEKLTFDPKEIESIKDYSDRILESFRLETEIEEAEKQINRYKARKVSLEEKIEMHASSQAESETRTILMLMEHLKCLMESDACRALSSAEIVPDDEQVMCDALHVEMSKCVLDYYQKIVAFVDGEKGVDAFLKEVESYGYWSPTELL